MAQDITLLGASYSDVPAVNLPKTGGGTAQFTDITTEEGKVVSNGSLVSQTSATYTANDTYDTTTVSSVTVNVSGGGGALDGISDIASGSVTFTKRYQTTGNRAIVDLADIGFEPTRFFLTASPTAMADIYDACEQGTETNVVMVSAMYVQTHTPDFEEKFHIRAMSRIGGTTPAASSAKVDTSWTVQNNNELYNDGTTIYFRTLSNYGIMANTKYYWLAIRDEVDIQ